MYTDFSRQTSCPQALPPQATAVGPVVGPQLDQFRRFIPALLLLLVGLPAYADVKLELLDPQQQNTLIEGKPFELLLETAQLDSVTGTPDFTPLKQQFRLHGSRSVYLTEKRQGRTHYISRWTLNLSAKQSGNLTIPSLAVKGERSKPLVLNFAAKPLPLSQRLRLTSQFELTESYPGYPLSLRVKLSYNLPLSRAEITQPQLDGIDFEPVGNQRSYNETQAGKQFQVIEQRYLLFAKQPGSYRLPSLQLSATDERGQPISVASDPVAFSILPWPEAINPPPQLVASEARIEHRWLGSLEGLRAGDTLSREIELVAHGLPARWLPEISLPVVDGVTFYPQPAQLQQSTINGVLVSRKTIELKMLLTRAGPVTLPPLNLSWWDSVREQQELATLPAADLEVGAFLAAPATAASDTPESDAPTIAPQPTAGGQTPSKQNQVSAWQAWVWALIALVCACGWALNWQKRKQLEAQLAGRVTGTETPNSVPAATPSADSSHSDAVSHPAPQAIEQTSQSALAPSSPPGHDTFAALSQACRSNDAELSFSRLFDWADAHWPDALIEDIASIEQLAKDPTLGYLMRNLAHHAENPHERWDGDLLLERLERIRQRQRRQQSLQVIAD